MKNVPLTVGRGPVPRRASVLVGLRFSRGLEIAGETRSHARVACEGPALRLARPRPFTVGRGPVPRRAITHMNARGGQAPALRAKKGFSSPCGRSGAGAPELQSLAPNLVNPEIPAYLLPIL